MVSFSPSHHQKSGAEVLLRGSHCHSNRPSVPALTQDQQSQTDAGSASSARSPGFAVLSLLPQRGWREKDTDPVGPDWLLTVSSLVSLGLPQGMGQSTSPDQLIYF